MLPEIITACEGFSSGKIDSALSLMNDAIQWKIIGDHSVMGKAGVARECKEAASHGLPNFKNTKTRWGKEHVIVEGGDKEADIYYCDIYTISFERITKITSYALTAID